MFYQHICICAQVNLMQYMKLSTSRDFRINSTTLDAALQEQDDNQEVSASYSVTSNLLCHIIDFCPHLLYNRIIIEKLFIVKYLLFVYSQI